LRWGEDWVVQLLIDTLLGWVDWVWTKRTHTSPGGPLVVLGDDAFNFPQDEGGLGTLGRAALESGIDNGVAYILDPDADFDKATLRMKQWDVGASALFVSECQALMELAVVGNRSAAIPLLRQRAARKVKDVHVQAPVAVQRALVAAGVGVEHQPRVRRHHPCARLHAGDGRSGGGSDDNDHVVAAGARGRRAGGHAPVPHGRLRGRAPCAARGWRGGGVCRGGRAGRPAVAGDAAVYFGGAARRQTPSEAAQDTAESVKAWLSLYQAKQHPLSTGLKYNTWQQSVEQLQKSLFVQ
jgi:hypothetical protein